MKVKKYTQEQQVIETLRQYGGYSTLGDLYHRVDTDDWGTKTPNESIRRIVQNSQKIFRIQPGLWALEECRDSVLEKFDLKAKDKKSEEHFTHSYYQGLIVAIGNMKSYTTYVPAQDQNRKFLETPLKEICSTVRMPEFGYEQLVNRARTVDVIWFNQRQMPNSFFEVEHSTDIQNSIAKFCDLQDYHSLFYIIAPENRHEQYNKVMERTVFKDFADRVLFRSYEVISKQYDYMCKMRTLNCMI